MYTHMHRRTHTRTLSTPLPSQHTHTHNNTYLHVHTHAQMHTHNGHTALCKSTTTDMEPQMWSNTFLWHFFFCLVCGHLITSYKLQGKYKKKKISNPELCEASQTKLFTCACRINEIKDFDQREFFSFSFVVELCRKLVIFMTTYQIFISNYGKFFIP